MWKFVMVCRSNCQLASAHRRELHGIHRQSRNVKRRVQVNRAAIMNAVRLPPALHATVIIIIIIIGVSLMYRAGTPVSVTWHHATEFTRNPPTSPSSPLIALINLTRYSAAPACFKYAISW